jgi:hypothetical protein
MLDPERATGIDAGIGFRFGADAYLGRLHEGRFDVGRGDPAGADLVFTADPTALAAVVYGGAPLETVGVEGDIALARRFVTLFPLPPKVEPPSVEPA